MGYELDNLKSKVDRMEFSLYRFVDREDFNREKYQTDTDLQQKANNWEVQDLQTRLDRIEDRITQIEIHLNL